MTYLVEVRSTVRRAGRPRLIPIEDVWRHRGFRSVYGYGQEAAEQIEESRSSKGLRGLDVYSDWLFTDFDGTDPKPLLSHLDSEWIAYEVYDSGNRSVHVHIVIEPMFGAWVPAAQKTWIRQHAPGADLSFYHPAGQYRLPGTYHAKGNGRCKELVRTQAGKALVIAPPRDRPLVVPREATPADAKEQVLALAMTKRGVGQRSPHIWLIAKSAAELGMSVAETHEIVNWWNKRFCEPPQDARTIERQINEGYRQTYDSGPLASWEDD